MKFTLSIKKNITFKYVLKNGKYAKAKYVVLHCMTTKYKNEKNFLGICVSKKNGNSVVRNKLKRWAREIYKEEELKLKKGQNLIILYKKYVTIDILDYDKIKQDILKCLKELNLYEKK